MSAGLYVCGRDDGDGVVCEVKGGRHHLMRAMQIRVRAQCPGCMQVCSTAQALVANS